MTTQEYVKKKAERLTELAIPGIMESETGMIAKQEYKNGVYNGLSAGIELAKEVLIKFAGCSEYRATELIEIHITERNGK